MSGFWEAKELLCYKRKVVPERTGLCKTSRVRDTVCKGAGPGEAACKDPGAGGPGDCMESAMLEHGGGRPVWLLRGHGPEGQSQVETR